MLRVPAELELPVEAAGASARPVGVVAAELASELDEAVWRVLEHGEDRVAHLLVETDGVEIPLDTLRDHAGGSESSGSAVDDQSRDEMTCVVVGDGDAVEPQHRHTIEDKAA